MFPQFARRCPGCLAGLFVVFVFWACHFSKKHICWAFWCVENMQIGMICWLFTKTWFLQKIDKSAFSSINQSFYPTHIDASDHIYPMGPPKPLFELTNQSFYWKWVQNRINTNNSPIIPFKGGPIRHFASLKVRSDNDVNSKYYRCGMCLLTVGELHDSMDSMDSMESMDVMDSLESSMISMGHPCLFRPPSYFVCSNSVFPGLDPKWPYLVNLKSIQILYLRLHGTCAHMYLFSLCSHILQTSR